MTTSATSRLSFGDATAVDASLADRVRGLVGSEILKIAAEVRALAAAGQPVCNLTVGDFNPSHFPIPEPLCRATQEALGRGETNYPPSDGLLELRQAVAGLMAHDCAAPYGVESVIIAAGARPVLYAAYQAVLNPGDTVVYPVPSWNNNHYAWLAGAKPAEIVTDATTGFQPTAAQVVPLLSRAQLVVLNTPHNPSGGVMDATEIGAIAEALVAENERRAKAGKRQAFLLFDQIYSALLFGDAQHAHPVALVPDVAPWVITVDGISKAFAATGLRVGWGVASPTVLARMRDLVGHVGAWAPRAEQKAVAQFLENGEALASYRVEMRDRVARRLTALSQGIADLRDAGYPVDCISPQGAIYLSLRVDAVGRRVAGKRLATNDDIRRALLERAGIAVVPFQAFGLREDTGWFRLSVGAVSVEDIAAALPRLRHLLDQLN